TTRLTLLTAAGNGSGRAWEEMVELYQPLVFGWLRRNEVAHHDAEELTQDVLAAVVRDLPSFAHSGNKGAFRHWLRRITVNRARGFWRAGKYRPRATGETKFLAMVDQLADDRSTLAERFDREHDRHVLRCCLQQVEAEFSDATLTAFRRQVFDGAVADDVAIELGMTVGAAYSAKSRVLRKLRQAAQGLVDESLLS
ncbi:MAG: sigma-70 family RNA polymerase sigma factor, partial [Planctomycetota bacterium]